MDTPEQPTVWPPAPTAAPPEAEQAEPFKIKLSVPTWLVRLASILKQTAYAGIIVWGVGAAIDIFWHHILHHKPLHFSLQAEMLVVGFMAIGLIKWQKL